MADVLIRKGDIELDRIDLDGAHILFDDIPDRNILVAQSGQIYAMNTTATLPRYGHPEEGFSVWPISIEITGRTRRGYRASGLHPSEVSVRIRVFWPGHDAYGEVGDSPGGYNLGELIYSRMGNKGRLENIHHYYNLEYQVRGRIEDVEEYGM